MSHAFVARDKTSKTPKMWVVSPHFAPEGMNCGELGALHIKPSILLRNIDQCQAVLYLSCNCPEYCPIPGGSVLATFFIQVN